VIDVNDNRFLSPKSMRDEIDSACRESGCPVPTDIGAYASLIYRSLAAYYKKAIMELEELTGRCYETIHIVGGGSKAVYLNRLIEEYTEKRVHAGPAEATAVGNIFVQMISDGSFKNINDARINTEIKEV
jgi:rhamnulokinase